MAGTPQQQKLITLSYKKLLYYIYVELLSNSGQFNELFRLLVTPLYILFQEKK